MPIRRPLAPSLIAAALVAGVGLAPPVNAQVPGLAPGGAPGGDRALLQQYCAGDYLRLCAGIDPNGSEVDACFQRNMSNLSPQCRSAIAGYVKRNPRGGHPTN